MNTRGELSRNVFLGRLYSEDPDAHAMLRRSKRSSIGSWGCGSVCKVYGCSFGLTQRCGRDVEALLRQGAQNNWMPEPDAVVVPSEEEIQGLVAEQIGKMNGRASPGFDCMAAPLIKYAAVVPAGWCVASNKIPDTQFGFYPGRNTLQPIYSLRHLQHAARTIKPGRSSWLHTAFIDFKQAYDTIPRQALWQHLQRTCMPTSFLSIIKNTYNDDEYILKDGEKTARVNPNTGAKQGCLLSPMLFSLYVNDIDESAEGMQGAVTGTAEYHVMHMLYADDLTEMTNDPVALQAMLNRLHAYAQRKHLIINTAKSEVVHFTWEICLSSVLGGCHWHTRSLLSILA
eukprot:1141494-Pelagomonas_calceolata.AAC.3